MIKPAEFREMIKSVTNSYTGLNKLEETEIYQLTVSLHPLVSNHSYKEQKEVLQMERIDTLHKLAQLPQKEFHQVINLLKYKIEI